MALLMQRSTASLGLPVQRRSPRVAIARSSATSAAPATAQAPPVAEADLAAKSNVRVLSSGEYEEFIASSDLVLVDYYTDWCGPCKMIAPHLEEMAAEMPNIKFAKLNCTTDAAAKKIAMSQGIKALPTFHLFKNNERVGVFVGGKPTALRKFLVEQTTTSS